MNKCIPLKESSIRSYLASLTERIIATNYTARFFFKFNGINLKFNSICLTKLNESNSYDRIWRGKELA